MKDKLTLDASGQYRRDLGWKPGRNGGYTQHRFYLGRDHDRAQRLSRKLEVLWDDIEVRFKRTPGLEGDRPIWTENTMAMAKGIITDAKTVFVRPPEIVSVGNEALDIELHGIWFERMVRDFRGMNLTFDHPTIPNKIAKLADGLAAKAARLRPANKSRETLHQALDAYKGWLAATKYVTPPEAGKERRTSQTGVKEVERVERLKKHVADMPLSDHGVKQIEDVVSYWANRPESSQGAAFAVTVCKHHIRCWKSFLHWLHKEPSDDQLEVYTNRPFSKVWEAQDKVWEQLKDIFVGEAVPEARITIGTIRKMEAMHAENVSVKEIAEACGVCESTVRDRLWGRTKKKQSPRSSE